MPYDPNQPISGSNYAPNTQNILSDEAESGFAMMQSLQNGGSPTNNIISTAGPATSAFNGFSSSLNSMLTGYQLPGSELNIGNVNDPYTQLLDRISRGQDASTKALIGTINAARSNRANEMATQYDKYKRGLQLLGIQHNDAQATPDLLMGHIQEAENEHQAKLQSLDIETNKALMDAQAAKDKNDLATLEAKMAYIDKLKKEKQDYLKNIAEQLTAANTIAENIVPGIYDELNKLSPAQKEQYLVKVSQKYGIPLGALVGAMVKESNSREDRFISNSKKSKSGSGDIEYTPQELRKLRQAGIDPENTTMADNFLYGENKGVLPPEFSRSNVKTFGKKKVWKLAQKLGVTRKKNFRKSDEIDALFANQDWVDYVQEMLNEGFSIDDIIDSQ